eukprot:1479453-Prymnesium_polylepis.1
MLRPARASPSVPLQDALAIAAAREALQTLAETFASPEVPHPNPAPPAGPPPPLMLAGPTPPARPPPL